MRHVIDSHVRHVIDSHVGHVRGRFAGAKVIVILAILQGVIFTI